MEKLPKKRGLWGVGGLRHKENYHEMRKRENIYEEEITQMGKHVKMWNDVFCFNIIFTKFY